MSTHITQQIYETCTQHFGQPPQLIVSAPGRVNLIGEHTDYNDGFVLPMAINRRVWIGGSPRDDDDVQVYSMNFDESRSFMLSSLGKQQSWIDYMQGVLAECQKRAQPLTGFNAVIYGNVPKGGGLSSSAALEVATAHFVAQMNGVTLSGTELALLCQRAENHFVGVKCGIMDQYISAVGQEGHALHLDCRDLSYQQIPFQPADYTVVICHSNVKRTLVDSAYNERRAQCEEGVRILRAKLPGITALRDVSSGQLATHADLLPPIVYQRCRHVVTENERVSAAVSALREGDWPQFGDLLNHSHDSLRDDYEVSCRELDLLVELARSIEGTLGARMTGAGFGGCMISLAPTPRVDTFRTQLLEGYAQRTGIHADVYVSNAEEGARVENIS